MIVINTVDSKTFSLNGVNYVKNFLSFVAGNKLCIYNAYDRTDERVALTIYSDYTVDGVVYANVSLLQNALISVIYTRDSLGGSGGDEYTSNKSQDVETDKLSVTKYPSVKALYDWAVGKFQLALVSGTNIKTVEGQSLLGTGNIDLTKSDVGLSNVDNTTDANKPISTATQTGLNLKQNTLTETNFGTFANTLTAKDTLIDADEVVSDDSADVSKAKKTTWLNVWTNYIKVKADALYHQGTVTTNTIPKATGTRTIGNSQITDNGTNVGIGTTTPAQKLYVHGGNIGVTYPDQGTGVSKNFTIGFKTGFSGLIFDALDSGMINFIGNGSGTITRFLNKGILRCTGDSTANYIQIQNNDVNSVISNSGVGSIVLQANSGNVLINTISNNGVDKLQVNGTISATAASTASQVVIKSQLDAKANTALTVRKISTNTTLAESDNGTVILLTASCTVTLPNGLSLGWNCSFVTSAGATMTYALGGSIVLINNTATTMAEKLSHTITNTGVTNEYLTVGL